MSAENLLQLELSVLAALVGLTRLGQPEANLLRALGAIRTVPDRIERQRLLTALMTLLPTEEVTNLVEKLLEESEALLLDTTYLRRMRELGKQEGWQIGREEGAHAVRGTILEAVARKFNPTVADYRQLQQRLSQIQTLKAWQETLLALLEAQAVDEILCLTQEVAASQNSPDA